ncbi:metal-dependent phosphohydrolase [Terrihabitans soli]|uniref:Metal-dependent phosphohydrolase n=1 Tax=Terrihabitans soli TaxID=708113 RepID=A0A6S6QLX7_9HYPH|nr:HD domain-containing protein [Terrihabitans soli]BCJ92343.1 metal-dependent phosphohydrolase [Terrihabitans soli]
MDRPGSTPSNLRLGELLGALSHALDLTEGQPEGHCVRCCWIGTNIGRELGLSERQLGELYYVLLLKDLGCSSNAARICQLYLTDDRSFKRGFKEIDSSLPQVLRFVLAHTGSKAGPLERLRGVINILQNGGTYARELIETRCQRGADIARRMRFSEAVAQGIQSLDEHWDGGGHAEGLSGRAIPLYARIALLSQVADIVHSSSGRDAARAEIKERAGSWFDPDIAAEFEQVAQRPEFWEILEADNLDAEILRLEPANQTEALDDDYLDDIAAAFAQVIDSKSPYTGGHSERVALFTDLIAEEMQIEEARRRWLKRTALLHDIGKLGVSSAVLDKAGKLDESEWREMKNHAALSEVILARIAAFADLARIAGAHHERLDGRGYPRGLSGDAICLETRIITTADIFDALTAERPYRAALPISKALSIMEADIGTAIDGACFEALKRALARLPAQEPVQISA